MGLFWSKRWGGRRGDVGITADRRGVHRGPVRVSCCGFSCFR
ncbi:hypothetical protein ACN47E_008366 [Coniothyrium glycines]